MSINHSSWLNGLRGLGGENFLAVLEAGHAGTVVVPGGDTLLLADFVRQGPDLVLSLPSGEKILIKGYFLTDQPPILSTEAGAVVAPEDATLLAGPRAPGQYAQATAPGTDQAIGQVNQIEGQVFATRADGTRVALEVGSDVFQGDVLETGSGAAVGLLFVDNTTFSLGDNARLVLNELIFNPASEQGSSVFSVLQGTFIFVTGKIAGSGDDAMTVKTPTGTIGIRGTQVGGEVSVECTVDAVNATRICSNETRVILFQEADGHVGQVVFSNNAGISVLSRANSQISSTSLNLPPSDPVLLTAEEADRIVAAALRTFVPVDVAPEAGAQDPEPGTAVPGTAPANPADTTPAAGPGTPAGGFQGLLGDPVAATPDPIVPPAPLPSPPPATDPTLPTTDTQQETVFTDPASPPPSGGGGTTGGSSSGTSDPNSAPPPTPPSPPTPPPSPPANLPPVLGGDLGVAVNEGGFVSIAAVDLAAADVDNTAAELIYTVTAGPANGRLELTSNPGVAVTSFSQADIDGGLLRYVHDGSETLADAFTVTVSDGLAGAGPVTVNVAVSPVNDAPILGGDLGLAVNEGGFVSIAAVDLAAADVDNTAAELTYTVTVGPANGRLELTSNPGVAVTSFSQADIDGGLLRYVHDGSETQADAFTVTVSDGLAGAGPVTVNVAVSPANDAPVLGGDLGLAVNEGGFVSIAAADLAATDVDNIAAELTYTVTAGPATGRLELTGNPGVAVTSFSQADIDGGLLRYVHDGSETQADAFTVTVSDGLAGAGPVTVNVAVSPANDAPVLGGDLGLAVEEGGLVSVSATDLAATDIDNTAAELIYTVMAGPANGRLELTGNPGVAVTSFSQADIDGGLLRYVHDGSEASQDSFIVTVSDGLAGADPVTVNVAVSPVNDAPILGGDLGLAVNEGGLVSVTVVDLAASDAETPALDLTYTVTVGPTNGRLELTGNPGVAVTSFSQADIDGGLLQYVHDGSETTADAFTVTVSDGLAGAGPVTVNVAVSPVNDNAPVGAADSYRVAEGGTLTVAAATGVLANDVDLDGDTLSAVLGTGPANGTLTLNPDGSFTYTPAAGFNGQDSFTYTASDGLNSSAPVTVTINVSAVNEAPVLGGDLGLAVNEGGLVSVAAADLAATDTDNTAAELTYTVTAGPANGRLELTGNAGVAVTSFSQADIDGGLLRYVHDGSETQADAFTVTVSDGLAGAGPVTVNVAVSPANDAPVLGGDLGLTVNEGGFVPVVAADLAATDVDNVAAELTYTVTADPANGRLELTGNAGVAVTSFSQADIDGGLLRYVHDGSETQADAFTVTVSDGLAGAGPVTVNVAVSPVNDAPILGGDLGLAVNEGGQVSVVAADLAASDVDNVAAELTYTVTAGPANGRLELTGNPGVAVTSFSQADIDGGLLRYVHDGSETQADAFTVTVSDGLAGAGPVTVNVAVSPANDAPVLGGDLGLTVNEGGFVPVVAADLAATDVDNVAAELTYTVTADPANGRLELTGNPGVAVTSFSQADIDGGLLRYVHDGSETQADAFTVTVSDGLAGAGPVTVNVAVSPANDAPVLGGDLGLTVNEGGFVPVVAADLAATDVDNVAAELTYTVTADPANGRLELTGNAGVAVTSFSQADIDGGLLRYVHDGSETQADAFTVTVSDGLAGAGPVTVNVAVSPANDAPVLGGDLGLAVDEGGQIAVAAADLAASDVDNVAADLVYTVTVGPANGRLELTGNPGVAVTSFSQADIDGGLLQYVHDGSETTQDAFTVTVSDGLAGAGPVTVNVAVSPVNDNAPVNTVPTQQTVADTGVLVFSAANNNAITVDDPDGDPVTVTLAVNIGTLVAVAAGTAIVNGAGASLMTISGSLADVNATLDGLAYTPVAGSIGASLTVTTSDGVLSDVDPVAIQIASAGNDELIGTAAADVIDGQGGHDWISGLGGNDTLIGGTGNDFLIGGAGDDSLQGGAGNDTADYSGAAAAVTVDLGAGGLGGVGIAYGSAPADIAGIGSDTLDGIETVVGSAFNDTLTGGGNNEWERFIGGDGNDRIDGGTGFDEADYSASTGPITVGFRSGVGTVRVDRNSDGAFEETDALISIERVTGSNHADTYDATGYIGDDHGQFNAFQGMGGDDTIVGNGMTRIEYSRASDGVTVDFGAGIAHGTAAGDVANVGTDTFTGVARVRGSDFADQLTGGGNDSYEQFEGRGGADIINGGTGFDQAVYTWAPAGVTVDLSAGTAVDGYGSIDTLISIESAVGSDFADRLTGDAGDNWLWGRTGDDIIDGGLGFDSAAYNDWKNGEVTGGIVAKMAAGTVTGDASVGTDTLISIERIRGTEFADTYDATGFGAGAPEFNAFRGLGGDDLVTGNGNTRVEYDGALAGVTVTLTGGGAGTAQSSDFATNGDTAGIGSDTFTGGVTRIRGTDFADTFIGDETNNSFWGGGGNDAIDGGAGIDRVRYDFSATTGIVADLVAGTATDGQGGTDKLANIENVRGTSFADRIVGDAGGNALVGLAGNDLLIGGAGNDVLDGGAGLDMADYSQATGPIKVSYGLDGVGTAQVDRDSDGVYEEADALTNIEQVVGTNFDDIYDSTNFSGSFGPINTFEGLGGNDTITGNGDFRIEYGRATAGVTVKVDNGAGTAAGTVAGDLANVGIDTFTGIGAVLGSNFDDTLIGGAGDIAFQGQGGADVIDGGIGFAAVSYADDPAGVVVDLGAGTATDGFGSVDTLLNIGEVYGSSFDDKLSGDAGDNWFEGQAGNDVFDGRTGFDTVSYEGWLPGDITGGIAVNMATGTVTGDVSVGTDTLVNIESIVGTEFADTYDATGFGGTLITFNTFTGGGGDDLITGNGGTAVSYWDALAGVTATLNAGGAGSAQSTDFAKQGDLAGIGTDTFTGGVSQLVGSMHADTLIGGNGSQVLFGDDGDDRIAGGAGADVLSGGLGADTFAFSALTDGGSVALNQTVSASGVSGDFIADFSAISGDIIELLGAAFGLTAVTTGVNFSVLDSGVEYNGANIATGSNTAFDAGAAALIQDGVGNLIYDANGAADGYTILANVGTLQILTDADFQVVGPLA